jgi:hypothetical protein
MTSTPARSPQILSWSMAAARKVSAAAAPQDLQQVFFEQGLRLVRVLGAALGHLLAQSLHQGGGGFDPHIRLDEQRLQLLPGFLGDFVCAQEVGDLAEKRLPGLGQPSLQVLGHACLHNNLINYNGEACQRQKCAFKGCREMPPRRLETDVWG